MKIAVTADHAGYNSYIEIIHFLRDIGYEVNEFGPKNFNPNDDYPDLVFPATKSVATKHSDVGIIIGGSGQGEAIAANRIKGIRCAVFYGPIIPISPVNQEGTLSTNPYEILVLSRSHNLCNMLSLGGRFLTVGEMKRAINVWLDTPLGDGMRHLRRVKKLDEINE